MGGLSHASAKPCKRVAETAGFAWAVGQVGSGQVGQVGSGAGGAGGWRGRWAVGQVDSYTCICTLSAAAQILRTSRT